MDETLALPSEHAVTLALRTQQVLAYETGVTNTVDPLGGSYFLETLTTQMQQESQTYFDRIRELGGMVAAIEAGFFRQKIAEAAFAYQQATDAKEKIIVGVNDFEEDEETPLEVLRVNENAEREQLSALARVKKQRNEADVQRAIGELKRTAEADGNVFPTLLEAARARATVGELINALADVLGRYQLGAA